MPAHNRAHPKLEINHYFAGPLLFQNLLLTVARSMAGSMAHDWGEVTDELKEEYGHPLWKEFGQQAVRQTRHNHLSFCT